MTTTTKKRDKRRIHMQGKNGTLMAYSASSSLLNSTNPNPWCTPVILSFGMCTFATGPAWIINYTDKKRGVVYSKAAENRRK